MSSCHCSHDAYALECQKRTAHAQSSGYYDHEIVPMDTIMTVKDKEKGTSEDIKYTVSKDECNRPSTTLESLQGLQPVRGEDDPHATVTAGNASQLSDGAAACVVMDGALASSRGVEPLGIFKGYAVAGCAPDEMGVGPVHAVPKLLSKFGFVCRRHRPLGDQRGLRLRAAVRDARARDRSTKANVNGGSIAIGHLFGMTGGGAAGRPHPAGGAAAEGEARRC